MQAAAQTRSHCIAFGGSHYRHSIHAAVRAPASHRTPVVAGTAAAQRAGVCCALPTNTCRWRRSASLACRSFGSSSAGSSSRSGDDEDSLAPQPPQQQQDESAQQQQQPGAQYSPEQEMLRVAMRKLQALETYQQLMADSTSGPVDKQLQRQAGDTPADVSGKIAADKDEIDVLAAAVLIAQHAYPDLEADSVRQQLDELAAEVEAGLPAGVRYPLRVIKEINRVLYQVHGFTGNSEDYYAPDNSCINRVLDTKRGIPISLSLVYMEVAARVGLPMAGVNLPAHFMIRPQVEGMEWLVDPFNQGELTALEDAEEVLGRLIGYQVKLDPRFVSGDTPPLSARAFLLRLLNNLKQIYITLNMAEDALTIVRYMRATAPAGSLPELQRDEGLCLYGLGRWSEATDALQGFLATSPEQRDADLVETLLAKIRDRAAAAAAAAAGGGSSSSVGEEDDMST